MKKGLRPVLMDGLRAVSLSLNRDLMKKGLRRKMHPSPSRFGTFESRPYEEGIKTLWPSDLRLGGRRLNRDLMKKGLRLHHYNNHRLKV